MAHVHTHENRTSFYLEQLLTIGTCGALGVVMILIWWYNVLPIFLSPRFQSLVPWGGVGLLALVAVRVVSLWSAVAKGQPVHEHGCCGHDHGDCSDPDHEHHHAHDHEHGHDHDHAHHHDMGNDLALRAEAHEHAHDGGNAHDHKHEHTHDHNHGHDHGFAPWRYAVLLIPIVLFLLRLPWPQPEEPAEANVIPMKLQEAEESSEDQQKRDFWKKRTEDNVVRLKGKFASLRNDQGMFVRMRMTCCFADAYPDPVKKIVVKAPKDVTLGQFTDKWVKVLGKLDYQERPDGQYVTVVHAKSIKTIDTPANQFDN
jgi:hypothetical protein